MKLYIKSSYGIGGDDTAFIIDENGKILEATVDKDFGEIPVKFDVAEYRDFWGKVDDGEGIDILDIGYWMADSFYEPADPAFRKDAKAYVEQNK